jgi:putative ABC transport system substrate-binding protein
MPRTRPQRMSAPMSASGGKAEMLRMAPIRPIPVVFMANGDPVASGLVASLNRPGGNMTGVPYSA